MRTSKILKPIRKVTAPKQSAASTSRARSERQLRSEVSPAQRRTRSVAADRPRNARLTPASQQPQAQRCSWLETADGEQARQDYYEQARAHGRALLIAPSASALSRDQALLSARGARGVALLALDAGQPDQDELAKVAQRGTTLILATSDALAHADVQRSLEKARVAAVAVDEAQLLSRDAHQFRPSFSALPELVRRWQPSTLTLLARPCRPELRRQVESLFDTPERPRPARDLLARDVTLECRAVRGERRILALSEVLGSFHGHGVVLCASPHEVDANFAALTAAGVAVCRAHAGMPEAEREAALARFIADEAGLTLLTTSGVGADSGLIGLGEGRLLRNPSGYGRSGLRRDLRLVVHFHAPASLEQYAQEVAWLGRDGLGGRALLFYDSAQRSLNESVLEQQRYAPKQLMAVVQLLAEEPARVKTTTLEWLALQSGQSRRTTERLVALLVDAALAQRSGNVVTPRVAAAALLGGGEELAERLAALQLGDAPRLAAVERFAEGSGCRREAFLRHFGVDAAACGQCSACAPPSGAAAQPADPRAQRRR